MSWASLAESLRGAGYRVATPDLPGHGTSRDTSFTWESARATVRAAAERFGPEKPVLIGLSLGAATAIYAAQREPTSFAGLVLSGAGACWNDRYLRCGLTVAAAVGALSAAVGRRELLAHAAGVRGREIVTAARAADVGPAQLWRAARQLTQFDVRSTPPPPIPCAVIVLTDDRRMPPGLQRALARYLGCPHVDVAADHDAPVRQTARFSDGVQTALTLLGSFRRPLRNRKIPMTTQVHHSRDAVVIGAGPAGLAVARELEHQHGIKTLVIDRAAAPAISWRTRYDNFRLNTTGFLSHLPGQRIPLTAGRWPTREDMVRYFDNYVRRQNITLELGCEVNGIDRARGRLATRHIVRRNPNAGNRPRHGQLPHAHHPFLARPESVHRRARSLRQLQKRLALPRPRRPRCRRRQFGRRHRRPARQQRRAPDLACGPHTAASRAAGHRTDFRRTSSSSSSPGRPRARSIRLSGSPSA